MLTFARAVPRFGVGSWDHWRSENPAGHFRYFRWAVLLGQVEMIENASHECFFWFLDVSCNRRRLSFGPTSQFCSYSSLQFLGLGCVLLTLYTGERPFPVQSSLQHLAVMQRVIGSLTRVPQKNRSWFSSWIHCWHLVLHITYDILLYIYIYIYIYYRGRTIWILIMNYLNHLEYVFLLFPFCGNALRTPSLLMHIEYEKIL